MARVLIVYGTRQGHTADIADRIASVLRSAGHEVHEFNLRIFSPPPSLQGYNAVLVGASVHARGYEREIRRWVRSHAKELAAVPNAFFSVSLTSASHDEKSNAEIDSVLEFFERQTGWWPARVEKFAGALVYSKYNWLLGHIMRRIVRRESNGRYTDMSRDYDLTDYAQVDAFATQFASTLASATAS